jgi:hypothetical protein
MVTITIIVDGIQDVVDVFDYIQIRRYSGDDYPEEKVTDVEAMSIYSTVSGVDVINSIYDVGTILLNSEYDQYYFKDPDGDMESWYIYQLTSSYTNSSSGWFGPYQSGYGDFNCKPQFPPESYYSASDIMIIEKIRLYIGDQKALRREFGNEALSSIHEDGKTYEMQERGWPVFINFGGVPFTTLSNPSVNGYRFLRFKDFINDLCHDTVTYSGICGTDIVKEVINGVDIWYNTFRHSDKHILDAYDRCSPPPPLNSSTANQEVYLLQTSVTLLRKELWADAYDDGAIVKDEGSHYDPSPGLRLRKELLDDLEKKLDTLVKSLSLTGIKGVRIE